MHDCALGREGGPSAPRVEHRYYMVERINDRPNIKHHKNLKPIQQFKRLNLYIWCFWEKRSTLYCKFETKLVKLHFFEKKSSIFWCYFDLKTHNLVIWRMDGEAICLGKIWSTWWVKGRTYIANSLIYPSWLRGRKVDKTDRLPQVLKDIQSKKTIKWDERR